MTIESCFTYYDYGKLSAQLSSEKDVYNAEEQIKIQGTIVNRNTFPLVDVILYSHIRRINTQTHTENGHYLIDKIVLAENLNFLANETKNISFTIPVKKTYPDGAYQIQYYILSKQAFHYSGRSFLEEDFAGATNFTINNSNETLTYFDINSLTVNGVSHSIREQIVAYPQGPLSFTVRLVDNRQTKTDIAIKIKFYSFEDTAGNKLISQTESTYSPDQDRVTLSFNPPSPGAYVLLLEMNSPHQSMFKYRFASDGEQQSELRMNDVGITDFPATSRSRAWVCFHSPTQQLSKKTAVTLTLLSSSQKVVDQVSYTDSFNGEVQAISLPLLKLASLNDFWIEAVFKDDSSSRSVRIHYNCDAFASSLKTVNLSYNPSQPTAIAVQTANVCGTEINGRPILDAIRVKQGEKLIKTASHYDASSGKFVFGTQPAGTYTAEARLGKSIKKITFNISEPAATVPSSLPNDRKMQTYLIILGGLGIIGIVLLLQIKKK